MSGATSRRRGHNAERAVAKYLRDQGVEAMTSRATAGFQKGFDIVIAQPFAIEVKDWANQSLPAWLDQVEKDAGHRFGVVWHKRRGKSSPGEWYVTMRGSTFAQLLMQWRNEDD